MKRFLFLASILALGFMFLAPQTTQAQFTQNAATFRSAGELTFTFAGAVDTVGGTNADLTSKAFSLIDYDALSTFTFAQKCTSAKGNPKVTALLKGSEDGTNYITLDTLCIADTAEAQKYVKFDINGVRAKFYKVNIFQAAGGRKDAVFNLKIRAWKRDY